MHVKVNRVTCFLVCACICHDTASVPASLCAAEGVLDGESWGLSVRQFTHLSPHEQVLLLVPQDCTASDVAAATAARVAKLTAAAVPSEDRQQLLVGLVQEDGPRHLPWCVHIFERLRLQRQVRVLPPPQALPFLWLPKALLVFAKKRLGLTHASPEPCQAA